MYLLVTVSTVKIYIHQQICFHQGKMPFVFIYRFSGCCHWTLIPNCLYRKQHIPMQNFNVFIINSIFRLHSKDWLVIKLTQNLILFILPSMILCCPNGAFTCTRTYPLALSSYTSSFGHNISFVFQIPFYHFPELFGKPTLV